MGIPLIHYLLKDEPNTAKTPRWNYLLAILKHFCNHHWLFQVSGIDEQMLKNQTSRFQAIKKLTNYLKEELSAYEKANHYLNQYFDALLKQKERSTLSQVSVFQANLPATVAKNSKIITSK